MTDDELKEVRNIKDLEYNAETAVRQAMNRGYAAGLEDGWRFARELINYYKPNVPTYFDNSGIRMILECSPTEAKKKFDEYKEHLRDFKKGDEVRVVGIKEPLMVIELLPENQLRLFGRPVYMTVKPAEECEKTGNHDALYEDAVWIGGPEWERRKEEFK